MNMKKNRMTVISIYIHLFLLIYTPLPIQNGYINNFTFLVFLFCINILPYILRQEVDIVKLFKNKYVMVTMGLIFLSSIYTIIIMLIQNVPINSIMDTRIVQGNVINLVILNIAIIIYKCKKINMKKENVVDMLINLAVIQGIICLLQVIIPTLKQVSEYIYLLSAQENSYILRKRIYGLSGEYTFGTQIYHGFIAGIAMYSKIVEKRGNFIKIGLIVIAVLLNGRTGIIPLIIFTIYSITKNAFIMNKYLSTLRTTIIGTICIIIVMNVLQNFVPDTYKFIMDFVYETINLILYSEATGNYEVLLDSYVFFPEGIGLIFGEGHNVYDDYAKTLGYTHSDIGFVNDIFQGGIIYITLLYGSILYLIKKSKLEYGIILYILLLIVNYKGEIFKSIPNIVLMVVLPFIMLFLESNKKSKHIKEIGDNNE